MCSRFKRLVRRTITFSRTEVMHDKVIRYYLTIHHYK
ncbi:IS1 family transposase [Photobacterium damselae]|nr:hypothetical protein FD718_12855 [Photobacterium damselae subsp. damselae]